MRDRVAAESPEEREARLQYMRDRVVAESPDERQVRLQLYVKSPECKLSSRDS